MDRALKAQIAKWLHALEGERLRFTLEAIRPLLAEEKVNNQEMINHIDAIVQVLKGQKVNIEEILKRLEVMEKSFAALKKAIKEKSHI